MKCRTANRAFTLIELLTVIAIIAVLAAIMFPVAARVREQARAAQCMTNLHNLWLAASAYKQDEGTYPSALLGYAERPDGRYATSPGEPHVSADRVLKGFLYREQVKDIAAYRCPDNTSADKDAITHTYFPPRPPDWPAGEPYIADELASVCGGDAFGTFDCFREPEVDRASPLYGRPKFFYVWDSYDIGPRLDASGRSVKDPAGRTIFDRHYALDWTGRSGTGDLPNQLKYRNPPNDRTLVAYCTWHAATAGTDYVTAVSLSGSARKLKSMQVLQRGANLYNQ